MVITLEQYARSRTDMELISEARAIYDALYRLERYSVNNDLLLSALQRELACRGYTFQETAELIITK
ncbi:MAG: hypothetical protein WC455_13230 [Dehalococcoidia bacterium]|jgi:hypothetical protein